MKRKLVNEDLIKIKKLLSQLHIDGKWVKFDFQELTMETGVGQPGVGENGELPPEELELQSEEVIIAEILAKSEVPEQTGLRYLQRFWEYFETDRDQIVISPYNVKLLQAIDDLFSRGLAPEEVQTILDDGENLFSAATQSSIKLAQDYFDSVDPLMEFEEEEDEGKTNWVAKASKWSLAALAVLIVVTIGSYQFGFLKSVGLYPGSRDNPEKALEERAGEERETEPEQEITEEPVEEIKEPVAPVVLMPEEITVVVLNGSGRSGVAGRFADKLKLLGYQVVDVDNADHFNYSRSQVINRLEGDEVLEVLELIPQAELLFEDQGEGDALITVIVGADYT